MEDIRDEEVQGTQKQASDETSTEHGTAAGAEENPDSQSQNTATGASKEGASESDIGSDDPMDPAKVEPVKDPEKKSFFSKKTKEKDKRDQQIEELTDRVQRQMAEFDNFRKRSEKEKSAMYEIGAKSVLEKILPTVDNFERGFANLTEEQKEDAFAQGMEKVYRQMLNALEGLGVKPIEAVGQPFDPNFHNAVMHVEDEEAGENVVVEEFQKGYMYRESVLRHSMVKVAN